MSFLAPPDDHEIHRYGILKPSQIALWGKEHKGSSSRWLAPLLISDSVLVCLWNSATINIQERARMKKILKNVSDLNKVPVGYVWESCLTRIGFVRTVLFALVTGDLNRIHVNPFTWFFFKSNLGGMTCPGDMVLSITKGSIHQIFDFEEDTEIIAFGYDSVEFSRPLRVGSLFHCRYTLLAREIVRSKMKCRWRIEVVDERNKTACTAVWTNGYCPVVRSECGRIALPIVAVGGRTAPYVLVTILLFLIIIGWRSYQPINEFSYPIAP